MLYARAWVSIATPQFFTLTSYTVNLMQTSHLQLSGHKLGGFTFIGHGLGWPLYKDHIIGHGGANVGYLAQISFQTVGNSKYGIVFLLDRGASLVDDRYLVDTFFPQWLPYYMMKQFHDLSISWEFKTDCRPHISRSLI